MRRRRGPLPGTPRFALDRRTRKRSPRRRLLPRGGTFAPGKNVRIRSPRCRRGFDPASASSVPSPENDGRTAIYDIAAGAVYLPDGRKLEAHSGIGNLMDNPRHVHMRMRGANAAKRLQTLFAPAAVSWGPGAAPHSRRRA